ncbi:MAG TPA: site-specific integrase [Candidatus Nanoarchaeia archaeon]|nr:site-specific integrase [Candidatus Nanoarchaeia archaeon]
MAQKVDIYNHERKHNTVRSKYQEGLQKAQEGFIEYRNPLRQRIEFLSIKNTQLILDFDTVSGLEGLSKCRRLRYMEVCKSFALLLKKDFDTFTDDDIQRIVLWIDDYHKNPYTRQVYKVVLKKFIKYLQHTKDYLQVKEYPSNVRWIKTYVKKKDQSRIEREELLTEEEIKRGIEAVEYARDKAMFALQSEVGCRVGELANMQIKDIITQKINDKTEESEYFIRLNGKTGERTVIIFYSIPYLVIWLNQHPAKNNKEAPLWTLQLKNEVRPMKYAAIRKMVQQIYKKAGINKRPRTHYIRHSRVTLDGKSGMGDGLAKRRFGWTNDSKQLGTYSHLVDEDVHDFFRLKHHKGKPQQEPILVIKSCYKCNFTNPVTNDFCGNCKTVVSVGAAERLKGEQEKKTQEMELRMQTMEQILSQVAAQLPAPTQMDYNNYQVVVSQSGLTIGNEFKAFKRKE